MKLKHETISVFILIVYAFAILLLSFFIFGKMALNEDKVRNILVNVDVVAYLKNDEEIKKMSENNRIPNQVFDYIDSKKSSDLLNTIADNLYSDKSKLLLQSDVEGLLVESIKKYEAINSADIYKYIYEDISSSSYNISKKINNEEFIDTFRYFNDLFNSTFLIVLVVFTILILLTIFILERFNALFLTGIINVLLAVLISYSKENLIPNLIGNNYFKEDILDLCLKLLGPIYASLAMIGFMFVLIYLMKFVYKLITKVRIWYYDKYYGG